MTAAPRSGWGRSLWIGLAGALLLAAAAAPSPAADLEAWVHVDTASGTLRVKQGERVVARFPDVAVGRGGVSRQRLRGDQRTPLGDFRVVEVIEDSQFHRFFLIDYPDAHRAEAALRAGTIDQATFDAIRDALAAERLPPQNTPLGGRLGIHGLGGGDPGIHEAFNWTNGCVALTNEQIDRLTPWMRVGTRVVID